MDFEGETVGGRILGFSQIQSGLDAADPDCPRPKQPKRLAGLGKPHMPGRMADLTDFADEDYDPFAGRKFRTARERDAAEAKLVKCSRCQRVRL